MLLSCLSMFSAAPAVAADAPAVSADMQAIDKKSFGKKKPGDNRPRRKARKRKDPYRGPFKKGRYPSKEILRPLVLPEKMVEVNVGGDYLRFQGGDGGIADFGFNFGIGNILEVGVNSGLNLAPDFAWNEMIGLHARVLVSDGQRLDWAPSLDVGIPTNGGPGMLVVGLGARHLVSKKVFLVFGDRAIPITLGANPVVSLVGNAGVGFQASKKVAVIADTSIITVNLSNDTNITGIWETLVLNGAVQFTPDRQVDLGIRGGVATIYDGGATSGNVGAYVAARF